MSVIQNNDDLIKEAGNTIFENIYKNCQNEIKDKIITKLLDKIQQLIKKIEIIEKENKKMKDNFIYVLKRILSSKEQSYPYYNYNYNIKKLNNLNKYIDSDVETNFTRDNNRPNYSILDSSNNLKYRTEFPNANDSSSNENFTNENSKEKKAKKYLNNLYRNNFGSYMTGTPYRYFINKNKYIYDELFNKYSRNKNKSHYFHILHNFGSPGRYKMHRRYNSSGGYKSSLDLDIEDDKTFNFSEIGSNNKTKNASTTTLYHYKVKKDLSIFVNKTNKKKTKKGRLRSVDDLSKIPKKNRNYKNQIHKRNKNASISIDKGLAKINKNTNIKLSFLHRSPYLVNKL